MAERKKSFDQEGSQIDAIQRVIEDITTATNARADEVKRIVSFAVEEEIGADLTVEKKPPERE